MKIILFLTSSLFALLNNLNAQNFHNEGNTISITPNTIFTVGEDFTNRGEIINDGSLTVSGSWMNMGTYDSDEGELTLNSEEPQVVNHNAQSFTRLNISGGGEKLFEADITIENELVLNSGKLVSEDGAQLIIQNNAIVMGGSDEAYVEGTIIHQGTGNKFFPLGLNNSFLPIELIDVTGVDPEIAFSVTEPNLNTQVSDNLIDVSSNRFWTMELVAGTFDGSLVNLAVNEELFLPDLTAAVVAQADDINSPFSSLGQSESTGSINSGTITSELSTTGFVLAVGLINEEILSNIDIKVFNALSPNGDDIHDFLKIDNITEFPNNTVIIYNRWGDKVFEIKDYDNDQRVFEGIANTNGNDELIDGTYFFTIDKNDGSKAKTGFIEIRR